MYTLELYRKYFYNRLKDKKNVTATLEKESVAIGEIISGMDKLFYGDVTIFRKTPLDIYTLIKKEILTNILEGQNRIDEIIYVSRFLLEGLLNEINSLKYAV